MIGVGIEVRGVRVYITYPKAHNFMYSACLLSQLPLLYHTIHIFSAPRNHPTPVLDGFPPC